MSETLRDTRVGDRLPAVTFGPISRATLGDLEKVPGVNAATARRIYDHFNEKGN